MFLLGFIGFIIVSVHNVCSDHILEFVTASFFSSRSSFTCTGSDSRYDDILVACPILYVQIRQIYKVKIELSCYRTTNSGEMIFSLSQQLFS
jgi:hypothetical protein